MRGRSSSCVMERRAFRVDPRLLDLAKEMRKRPAPAEQKLWYCLRDRRLNGFKFRRQVAIDRYVADFYCAETKLIVESDGESHVGKEKEDAARTARLNELGFVVIRYSNVDVHENIEGALLAILDECERRRSRTSGPSPQPSPPSTRERE
jgi:very-short-patch-repair endonuclease